MDDKKNIINIEVSDSRDNSAIVKAYHDRLMEETTAENGSNKPEDGA